MTKDDSNRPDPANDLAWIRSMVETGRARFEDHGSHYVLFGSLCVIGTASSYAIAMLGLM